MVVGAAVVVAAVVDGVVVGARVVEAEVVGASVAGPGEAWVVVDAGAAPARGDDECASASHEEGPPIHGPHFHPRAALSRSRASRVWAAPWP